MHALRSGAELHSAVRNSVLIAASALRDAPGFHEQVLKQELRDLALSVLNPRCLVGACECISVLDSFHHLN